MYCTWVYNNKQWWAAYWFISLPTSCDPYEEILQRCGEWVLTEPDCTFKSPKVVQQGHKTSQITSPHTDIFTSGIIHDTVPVLKFFQQLWSQNTKPCCYSVYLKPCATELQNSVFFITVPPQQAFYQTPRIWPCMWARHFPVCASTCCCAAKCEIFCISHAHCVCVWEWGLLYKINK